ncbi:MAG TPA: hypothetical protein VIT68_04100, partial [Candidatus Gracilibacteria bacterium]
AKDFDFSRPFFDQFEDFIAAIPRLGVAVTKSENCDYNMYCVDSKNCYLCQRVQAEDCYYCYLPVYSRDCADCYNINTCELCYEVIDGQNCYEVAFAQNVVHCRNSKFLFDCRSCQDCFFCAGVRNAQYYFCNEKYTKEDYEKKIAEFKVLSRKRKEELWTDFLRLKSTLNVPVFWGNMTENSSGNYLFECKNVHESFDIKDGEDIKYAWGHIYGKDSMDTCFNYHNNNCYELCSSIHSSHLKCSYACYNECLNLEYCMLCMNNSQDLLGCFGMKKAKYCILNKPYSESDYKALRLKIIDHMKETREWGAFFPAALSDFAYNETVAQEYFPLDKVGAEKLGYRWRDSEDKSPDSLGVRTLDVPDNISDVSDSILKQTLYCEKTGKPFKIQKGELKFYKKMGLPLPVLHHDERYRARVALRNPRKLWDRQCGECKKDIRTSYVPGRTERVLCEGCYLKSLD